MLCFLRDTHHLKVDIQFPNTCYFICAVLSHFRRTQWHPTPVLLPGKSHGRRSLVGCSPWGLKESDMTEQLTYFHNKRIWIRVWKAISLLIILDPKRCCMLTSNIYFFLCQYLNKAEDREPYVLYVHPNIFIWEQQIVCSLL